MQSLTVLAPLVFELAGGGGQNDPLGPLRYKKHLSPLRVKPVVGQPNLQNEGDRKNAYIRGFYG